MENNISFNFLMYYFIYYILGNALMLLRPKSLREQQVARLRGEMAHLGGVRLRLRTGDCPGEAMALADAYGTVWYVKCSSISIHIFIFHNCNNNHH